MAEIEILVYRNFKLNLRQIFLCLLTILVFSFAGFSQTTQTSKSTRKPLETYARLMKNDKGGQFRKLLRDVRIKDSVNNVIMFCDSAYHYPDTKVVRAFSKVHIKQADTLDLYGDYLYYDGLKDSAFIQGHVILIDKETHLYTKALTYDIRKKIAFYNDSGKIVNAKNTLTSIIGVYYTSQKLFHFKESVKIVNPDYVMTADTMDYNTESETAFFTGPTELKGDSIYLFSEKGWYDTKNNISRIWKHSVVDNKKQIIHGDSIFFDDKRGFGEAFRNITIQDTTNSVLVTGNYAWYFKDPESFLVRDSAVFIQVSGADSLFLHSDTISAVSRKTKAGIQYRLMRAFHNCKIYSQGLQAKCDSLSYSFQDSVIRLYRNPVLWSDENQMTADSIAIFTKERHADFMELYNTAFIVSLVDSIRFNQIKGRNMKGLFRENKLFKILIDGNGETIYFLQDKTGQVGWNQAKSSSIEIYIDKGKINTINEYQNPEGVLNPPYKDISKQRLPGYKWLDNFRPKNKSDIFKK